jgi:hypothetical protein
MTTIERQPAYELSAAARILLAEMTAAHDDPAVSVEQFRALAPGWTKRGLALEQADRDQLCLANAQHIMRHLLGRPRVVVEAMLI